jgi:hypothetical protein
MDEICEFIIANSHTNNKCYLSVLAFMTSFNIIDEICNDLFCNINAEYIADLQRFDENQGYQNAIIISFKYKNVKCYIHEHFNTHYNFLHLFTFKTPIFYY